MDLTTDDGISLYRQESLPEACCRKRTENVLLLFTMSSDNIPLGKSEKDPELRNKLLDFKNKVRDGRFS